MSDVTPIPWGGLTVLKALAILIVVAVHSPPYAAYAGVLTPLNVGVPIFLFVQAFIVFAKLSSGDRTVGSYYDRGDLWRMTKRIVLPWCVLSVVFAALGFRYEHTTEWVWNLGAFGPGSYYLALYLISYFALPLLWLGLRRCGAWALVVGCVGAVAAEVLFPTLLSSVRVPALVYRCTPVRYLGVFALAFAAVTSWSRLERRRERAAVFALMAVSLALAVVGSIWPSCRLPAPEDYGWWICHLPYYVFPCGLSLMVLYAFRKRPLPRAVSLLGRSTWYVFLAQMLFYACLAK